MSKNTLKIIKSQIIAQCEIKIIADNRYGRTRRVLVHFLGWSSSSLTTGRKPWSVNLQWRIIGPPAQPPFPHSIIEVIDCEAFYYPAIFFLNSGVVPGKWPKKGIHKLIIPSTMPDGGLLHAGWGHSTKMASLCKTWSVASRLPPPGVIARDQR